MERKHLILLIIWAWLLPCAHGQNVLPYKTQTIDGVEYYIYPVKRSEGLYRISVNFGVTQEEIIRLNPEVKDGLRAGQLLFIPKKTPQAQPTQQSTSDQPHTPPPVDLIAASLAGSHATPPPAAPQPTASTPQPDNEPNFYYHKVLPKQTLYSLSKQYGVRQDDIIRYNPQAATGLRAGEVLRIPKPEDIYQDRKAAKQQEDLSVKYLIHRVQPKETLYAISKQYAVEMNDILRLNPGLEVLTIGQELKIPYYAALMATDTVDGQERTLDDSMLMICDGKKAVGLAGIMGGENSMITDSVKTMLFEAACFDGTNIRLSSKKVGLRTDASSKFEKGLDPNNAIEAMNRACQLIEELGAGEVVGGVVDVYPKVKEGRRIPFEPEKYNRLLGTSIEPADMLSYFAKLELGYDEASNEILVPSWRQDLECDADLAEEVARFFGYDKIPTTLPSGEATAGKLTFKLRIEGVARDIAEFCGFSQGMTYSFESPKVYDKLLLPADSPLRRAVVISNPLGEDFSIMRTISLNGMLTSLATNFNRRNKNVRLYELGNIYLPKQLPVTELPEERMQFTLGMYGEGDFYTMKGVIEEFLYKVGMKCKPEYAPKSEKPFLHPGRQANVIYDGTVIGYLGEVHPTVAANYDIKERVYVAVLDMPEIVSRASFDHKYEGIAKFPAAARDISMIVPKSVLAGDIEKVFDAKGGKLLEKYELFDVYEGAQIKPGYKSLAYSLSFRAKDRNLEEADITGAMDKIIKALEAMGAELRK